MPVCLNDIRLARRLLAGDEKAFGRFFDDNFARLYRFAAARLPGDTDVARDVVQCTLTRALEKMHTYRGEAALFTWLCTICRHEIADRLADRRREREHVVLIEDRPDIRAAVESAAAPTDESPEAAYGRTETLRLIQVALDRLPPRYGDVLEWKYIEGHSVKDIAARLGIGGEAAQSLLARAKRAFADVYGTLDAALTDAAREVRP